ncbi:hypothetical protein EGT74_23470 [Chitinophaga lutea]|uniref:Uncharacterized protein n=1 Tax=Chitinophaga lutea TaxID=2488634 RepID=A0A3N4P9M2_9BACT|nr:hypothetical protein [Chitinophaga lutea]RPE05352.1 hypothetical protein EGT74_23470 [Chitinophaga lutea]
MTIEQIFQDKVIKAKAKVSTIGQWLANGELPVEELLAFAEKQKAADKATCIEAVEYATKTTPALADEHLPTPRAIRSLQPFVWITAFR